jgi:hypothetical protein
MYHHAQLENGFVDDIKKKKKQTKNFMRQWCHSLKKKKKALLKSNYIPHNSAN